MTRAVVEGSSGGGGGASLCAENALPRIRRPFCRSVTDIVSDQIWGNFAISANIENKLAAF